MVEKSSEVIGELSERILLRLFGFVSLTVAQHIRGDNTVASLNPRADLVFPGNPNRQYVVRKQRIFYP